MFRILHQLQFSKLATKQRQDLKKKKKKLLLYSHLDLRTSKKEQAVRACKSYAIPIIFLCHLIQLYFLVFVVKHVKCYTSSSKFFFSETENAENCISICHTNIFYLALRLSSAFDAENQKLLWPVQALFLTATLLGHDTEVNPSIKMAARQPSVRTWC